MYKVQKDEKDSLQTFPEYFTDKGAADALATGLGEGWEAVKVAPMSEEERPPVSFFAMAQPLVNNLWMEARYWRKIATEQVTATIGEPAPAFDGSFEGRKRAMTRSKAKSAKVKETGVISNTWKIPQVCPECGDPTVARSNFRLCEPCHQRVAP